MVVVSEDAAIANPDAAAHKDASATIVPDAGDSSSGGCGSGKGASGPVSTVVLGALALSLLSRRRRSA